MALVIHADADEDLQFQSFVSDFRVGAGVVAHGSELIDESVTHVELAEVGAVGLRVVVERGHVGGLDLAAVGAHGEVFVIDAILVYSWREVDVERGVDQLLLPGGDGGLLLLDGCG